MTEQKWREEFSRKLRTILNERNITQADLAHGTNISEISISRYICRLRTPSGYVVFKICEFLGLPDNYFSTGLED